MQDATTPTPQNIGTGTDVIVTDIRQTASDMSGWLKFLGVINIIYGALTALSIVGIIIAWIPIWMGVLLFQAGSSATNAQMGQANHELVTMVRKLKTFFILTSILIIVSIATIIIVFFTVGIGILPFLDSAQNFNSSF
jgi:hypothetical protein